MSSHRTSGDASTRSSQNGATSAGGAVGRSGAELSGNGSVHDGVRETKPLLDTTADAAVVPLPRSNVKPAGKVRVAAASSAFASVSAAPEVEMSWNVAVPVV